MSRRARRSRNISGARSSIQLGSRDRLECGQHMCTHLFPHLPVVCRRDRLPGGLFREAIAHRHQHPRRTSQTNSSIERRPRVHPNGDVTPVPEHPHRISEASAHLQHRARKAEIVPISVLFHVACRFSALKTFRFSRPPTSQSKAIFCTSKSTR